MRRIRMRVAAWGCGAQLCFLAAVVWWFGGRPGWWRDWGGADVWLVGLPAVGGLAMLLLGLLVPGLTGPLVRVWRVVTTLLNRAVAEVLILLVYAILLVPLGWTLRRLGRDVLGLRLDRSAASYWTDKPQPASPGRYFRPW